MPRRKKKKNKRLKTKHQKTALPLKVYNLMEFFGFCIYIFGRSNVESSFLNTGYHNFVFLFLVQNFWLLHMCRSAEQSTHLHGGSWMEYKSHNQTSLLGDRKG